MITAKEHGELETAAIRYATNELKSRSTNCVQPESGIKWILAWFKANGYLHPRNDSRGVEPPDVLRVSAGVEFEFLQACREALAEKRKCDIWDADWIAICQIVNVETDLSSFANLTEGRLVYDQVGFDQQLTDLLRHASRIKDTRGLAIGLVLVAEGLRLQRPCMQEPLAALLSGLNVLPDRDLAEFLSAQATPSRWEQLCKILLHWLHRKESFASGIQTLVQRLVAFRDDSHFASDVHFRRLMRQYERVQSVPQTTDPTSQRNMANPLTYNLLKWGNLVTQLRANRPPDSDSRSYQSFELERPENTPRPQGVDLEIQLRRAPGTAPPGLERVQPWTGLQSRFRRAGNEDQLPPLPQRAASLETLRSAVSVREVLLQSGNSNRASGRLSSSSDRRAAGSSQDVDAAEGTAPPLRNPWASVRDKFNIQRRREERTDEENTRATQGNVPEIEITTTTPDGNVVRHGDIGDMV